MTAQTDSRLARLFDRGITLPPEGRSRILAEAAASDPELARELALLLSAHDRADAYFEKLSRDVVGPAVTAVGLDDLGPGSALRDRLEAALAPMYRIERELHGGGMSHVFVATDMRLARQVVIKVLPPSMSAGVSVERFRREIRVSAGLQHPHIVPVLASDATDGLLYYVMPYVDGETLRARIAREGSLPLADALAIWRDMLDALGFAHQHGVVHRDVKPGNILLSGRNALVADFGIARAVEGAVGDTDVTAPGTALGTPSYMAPEQASGDRKADHRVDTYAAGLVMYEMLTGRSPFAGLGLRDTVLAHLAQAPPPITRPDVPSWLAALVLRCLEKRPEARPATVEAILHQLERATAGDIPPPRRRRTHMLGGIALGASMLLAIGGYMVRERASSPGTGDFVAGAATDTRPSLVVLPLTNLSPDTLDAVLANGMTEELIGTLSRNSGLRVIASTSVYALTDARLSALRIAENLHVSNILEGSIQKIGMRLRMQLRLVDARDGSTRWAGVYERDMTDIFAVQTEIARAVGDTLNARLGVSRVPGPDVRRYTPSIAAYEWYLRGMDTGWMRSDTGTLRARESFSRAIAADSNFAAAYAGLARTYIQLGQGSRKRDRRAWVARAESVALKAVALDSSLAEAHAALGWVRLAAYDYSGAEPELRKAVALNTAALRAHEGLARLYMMTGRLTEQLVEARLGMEIDPFSAAAIREMALALHMNGRCDEVMELLPPLKSLSPPAGVAGIVGGQCYATRQMWPEAIAEYRWALEQSSSAAAFAFLGHALARGGHEEEARRILSDLLAERKNSQGAFGIAVVQTGLREYDAAFASLAQAADEQSITSYIALPMFADLHRDPRYEPLIRRLRSQKR